MHTSLESEAITESQQIFACADDIAIVGLEPSAAPGKTQIQIHGGWWWDLDNIGD